MSEFGALPARKIDFTQAAKNCRDLLPTEEQAKSYGYKKLDYSGSDHVDFRYEPTAQAKKAEFMSFLIEAKNKTSNEGKSPIRESDKQKRPASIYSYRETANSSRGVIGFFRRYRGS